MHRQPKVLRTPRSVRRQGIDSMPATSQQGEVGATARGRGRPFCGPRPAADSYFKSSSIFAWNTA